MLLLLFSKSLLFCPRILERKAGFCCFPWVISPLVFTLHIRLNPRCFDPPGRAASLSRYLLHLCSIQAPETFRFLLKILG
ncbi:hypothetical protein SLEP1_g18262 [Rubroshorea leprosula]|uniref:Secreted protein n=1 Tax=Rubroshorea leprosula TaxID=152421 RepID=A0AAV5IWY9_9ROSI|nr:hypothetical protein SLEP1_g18262 [Rubroshorea leprosula]